MVSYPSYARPPWSWPSLFWIFLSLHVIIFICELRYPSDVFPCYFDLPILFGVQHKIVFKILSLAGFNFKVLFFFCWIFFVIWYALILIFCVFSRYSGLLSTFCSYSIFLLCSSSVVANFLSLISFLFSIGMCCSHGSVVTAHIQFV